MAPATKKSGREGLKLHFFGIIKDLHRLASVAHTVIQAIGRTELEDGTRTGVRLKRLHAHCGVCSRPTQGRRKSGASGAIAP